MHVRSPARSSTRAPVEVCPDAGWLRGVCIHGTERWVKLNCKRRTCLVCGETRKHLIAWRIALGVEQLGGDSGAGWFVGTWASDIVKPEAVKQIRAFVQLLRRGQRVRALRPGESPDDVPWFIEPQPDLQYACTWERQKNGRLHCNMIMAPYLFIKQWKLSKVWERFGGGSRVWIKRVGAGIGHEAAKDRQKHANYIAKWDQMVLEGRGVTYSKGWPKLPKVTKRDRVGEVSWGWIGRFDPQELLLRYEIDLGHWVELSPCEYASAYGEDCDCFEYKAFQPGAERRALFDKELSEGRALLSLVTHA